MVAGLVSELVSISLTSCIQWVRGAASFLSRSRTLQYYLNLYGLDSPKEQYFTIKDPPSLVTRNIEGCHNDVVEMSDGWTDQH